MFFLYGCACLYFSDLLAYGYAVMILNVLRSDITIKNSTGDTFYKGEVNWEFLRKVDSHPMVDLKAFISSVDLHLQHSSVSPELPPGCTLFGCSTLPIIFPIIWHAHEPLFLRTQVFFLMESTSL